jgi:hypothetical protein
MRFFIVLPFVAYSYVLYSYSSNVNKKRALGALFSLFFEIFVADGIPNFEELKFKFLISVGNVWVKRHIVIGVVGREIALWVFVDVDFEDGGIEFVVELLFLEESAVDVIGVSCNRFKSNIVFVEDVFEGLLIETDVSAVAKGFSGFFEECRHLVFSVARRSSLTHIKTNVNKKRAPKRSFFSLFLSITEQV